MAPSGIMAATPKRPMERMKTEIREDRVEAVRRQIAAGTYETSDKLNIAVGRLLDEIG